MKKAIINAKIYDFNTYLKDGYVVFDEKIIKVGPMSEFEASDYQLIDAKGYMVLPGLINNHNHIYSTFARGLSIPFNPTNFQEILDQFWWKLDSQLDLESIYYSGVTNAIESVKAGVTTMIDHHASGLVIKDSLSTVSKAVDQVGLRGIYCFETSDRFNTDECIDTNLNFIKKHQSNKVTGMFGMHASMSLSDETLYRIKERLGDTPIHIHVAESNMDESLSVKRHGLRVIHRLENHGLLNENSLLAHCLYIDQEGARTIAEHNCKVVLNVSSNMNNGVGLPDFDLLKHADVDVVVGNDGLSASISNEYQMLYYAMHLKYLSPIAMNLDTIRTLINNSYTYVSTLLNTKIGKIEVDYEADLLMIPYINPTPMDISNVFSHVFFGLFNQFKPKHVWCMGKQIVTNYQVNPEIFTLQKEAEVVSAKLWNRIHHM